MAMATTRAIALATMLQVTKRVMVGPTREIVTNAVAAATVVFASTVTIAIFMLLLTPQSPNAVALSTAIAAAVAVTHLFDTAIKR
jgi:hypothetical protein